MDEKNNVTKSHKVLLANRKNGAFSGVVDVLSFGANWQRYCWRRSLGCF